MTEATTLGYLVHLHVVVVPEGLPAARVAALVAQGGHDVPTEKIRERYARLWPLVAAARDLADRSTFYDNCRAASPFRAVATYETWSPCRRTRMAGLDTEDPARSRGGPQPDHGGDELHRLDVDVVLLTWMRLAASSCQIWDGIPRVLVFSMLGWLQPQVAPQAERWPGPR